MHTINSLSILRLACLNKDLAAFSFARLRLRSFIPLIRSRDTGGRRPRLHASRPRSSLVGLNALIVLCFMMTGHNISQVQADGSQGRVTEVMAGPYQVTGDNKGGVVVSDKASGRRITTFQMKEAVVRGIFLLDDEKVLCATERDLSVFWDLRTEKKLLQIDRQIYGFSHNRQMFFTYSSDGTSLYRYPDLMICRLSGTTGEGPEEFEFSPDDRHLAVVYATGLPANDQNYPGMNPVRRGIRYTKLFDLQTCHEIDEFSKLNVRQAGEFSPDSRYYDLKGAFISLNQVSLQGAWRFDLATRSVVKLD